MEFARGPSTIQIGAIARTDQPKGRAAVDIFTVLDEVSRVSHWIEPTVSAEWMLKRMQFLAYELQTYLENSLPSRERLQSLNRFFFDEKKFRCIDANASLMEGLRLNRVLANRAGVPLVLELIYAYLADGIGLTLEFVDLKPIGFLKWRDGQQTHYIDLARNGQNLSTCELLETLNTRLNSDSVASAQVLEEFSTASFASEYFLAMKKAIGANAAPETLLYLQDGLIRLQPNNLQLLGERALLHRRLGNLKSALADLKRYFAFHDKTRSSIELLNLHNELLQHFESK